MDLGFIIIAFVFVAYILIVLLVEKKIIFEPREILEKFLAFSLLYVGFSIIFFALTGRPFLNESDDSYRLYLFLIGFISMLWAIPNILSEFTFFHKFMEKSNKKRK